TGRQIARTTLRDVLMSYRIIGKRSYLPQADRDRWKDLRKRGHSRGNEEPEPTVVDAVWPAILDIQTWSALRVIFTDRERRAGRGSRPQKNLLAGLLICGECVKEKDEHGQDITS